MRELIVTIDKDGTPTIEVKGVKGQQCLNLTQDIEKALGGKVLDRKPTAEMGQYAAEASVQQTNKLGG